MPQKQNATQKRLLAMQASKVVPVTSAAPKINRYALGCLATKLTGKFRGLEHEQVKADLLNECQSDPAFYAQVQELHPDVFAIEPPKRGGKAASGIEAKLALLERLSAL